MPNGLWISINGFKFAGVTEAIQSTHETVTKVGNSFCDLSVRVPGMLYRFRLYYVNARTIKRSNSSLQRIDTGEKYNLYFELIM